MSLTISQIIAVGIAVLACVFDLRTRRIPNWLTFGAAAAAVLVRLVTGGFDGLTDSVLGWLVGVGIFVVPFALGGMGGGDVKLLAALGAWLGPTEALWVGLYSAIAGSVMGIGVALIHGYLRRALENLWLLLCHWRVAGLRALPDLTLENSTAPKLAFAVPILTGMVAVIWLR